MPHINLQGMEKIKNSFTKCLGIMTGAVYSTVLLPVVVIMIIMTMATVQYCFIACCGGGDDDTDS